MTDDPVDPNAKNVIPFPGTIRYRGPKLPEKCWRSGFREFRDAHAESTEACNEFLFNAYLVAIGCVIGRRMNIRSSLRLHANFYTVNVGMSGRSRKTTAQGFLIDLLEMVQCGAFPLHGISSPEGLIMVLSQNEKVLVVLNEIKSFFIKGAQESTRGLIPKLTELYDCPKKVSIPTKKDPITVENPFICMISSTTREWFHNSIDPDDIRGGLAGRFLYFAGPDKAPNPWPDIPNEILIEEAKQRLIEVAAFHHTENRVYSSSAKARGVYDPWYRQMRTFEADNELLDAIGQRLHTHALKMAMIYAALDQTTDITVDHMEAAVAFADYQREVHKYVLEGIGDSNEVKIEKKIVALLDRVGIFLTNREIQRRFHDITAERLKRSLQNLAAMGAISAQDKVIGPWGPAK